MKKIDINSSKEELNIIIEELNRNNIEVLNNQNYLVLYKFLIKLNKKVKDELTLKAYNNVIRELITIFKYNKEVNIYYDLLIFFNSTIASEMIYKIKKYVYRIADTNSKNILIGDHKEKWGSIVGHIDVNRKDILIKILKFIKDLRNRYPYISSSYTYNAIGFDLNHYLLKNINDYKSMNKNRYGKKPSKYKYPLSKKTFFKKTKVKLFKNDILKNRKQIINKKYRYKNLNNLI